MRLIVTVLVFLAAVFHTQCLNHEWDMAVTVGDNVEFLDQNATLVGISHQVFHNLKAITFDDIRQEFVVSDMNEENDTIYRMKLSNTKNPEAIVKDIMDDVVDVAIDPIDDVLYWVDSLQRTIMKKSLNNSDAQSEILFKFNYQIPQGIAIDSCRRKIYWTNANHPIASIERSNLDGTEKEVIIHGNLFMPSGIVIDQADRKLYWTDLGEGIYFRIESSKLDGSNRRIIYQDTHQQPFRIAVSNSYIYWTDVTSYAIWGIKKDETGLKPEVLRRFNEKPKGLITKNRDFLNLPECQEVVDAIQNYFSHSAEDIVPVNNTDYCLNYGELTPYGCKCSRGFTGPRCEINLCHNLCFNGICYQSSQGYPKCKCLIGFTGERCEFELCKNFCLNGGSCTPSLVNSTWPNCRCPEGFSGKRCERRDEVEPVCECEDGVIVKPIDGEQPFCSCPSTSTLAPQNYQSPLKTSNLTFTDRIQDPVVLGFMFVSIILLLCTLLLSIFMCKLRHRRPRIKKRIIVNKNITPLTCRPNPPAEQCEITIENCCNMNICETPCFEPTSLRGFQRNKTEEKKTLLTSMENGEDLY